MGTNLAHKRSRGYIGQLFSIDPNHLHCSLLLISRCHCRRRATRRAARRERAHLFLGRAKFDWRSKFRRRFRRRPDRGEVGEIGPAQRVAIAVQALIGSSI